MSLSMKLEQGLEIKQKLTQAQRIEMRISLAQQLGYSIETIRREGGDAPESMLDAAINTMLSEVEDEDLRTGLLELFKDPSLRARILEQPADIAVLTPERIQHFILSYIFDSNAGKFTIEREGESEEETKTEFLETRKTLFLRAYTDPEKVEAEKTKLQEIVKTRLSENKEEDVSSALSDIREHTAALEIMETGGEEFRTIEQAFAYALQKRDKNDQTILGDFVRDAAILNRLDLIVSERMQKRFVARFNTAREGTPPDRFKNALMNTVGEYALISMGVVDPAIFSRQKAELNQKEYRFLRDELKKIGVDVDQLIEHYGLHGFGTLFWHRWKVPGQKPSRITDDAIRDFITQTVRADEETLLTALNFDSFYDRAAAINNQHQGTSQRAEREDELRELLVNTLADTNFEATFISLIKNNWYSKLDLFFSQSAEKTAA